LTRDADLHAGANLTAALEAARYFRPAPPTMRDQMPARPILLFLALTGLLAVAACKPVPENPYPGAENFGPQLLEKLRGECESSGGDFSSGGEGHGLVCHRTPPDAGKSCARQSDCTTECLARSRTCAPVEPLFGCNEVLTAEGVPVTLCID